MFRFPSLLIALTLAIMCFDMASGLEHWPFGSYPMYSLVYSKNFTWLRIYGVNSGGEFPMKGDRNFPPFDEARLVSSLARMRPSEWSPALQNLLRLHNRYSGTDPVHTIRLYAVSWTLHPGLQGDEPPDNKVLLVEVSSVAR